MEMKQIADLVQQHNEAFHEFKNANDERLKQLETNGSVLPETQAKVEAIEAKMSSVEDLKDRLEKAEVKLDSPTLSTGDMSAAEQKQVEAFHAMLRTAKEGERNLDPQAVAAYRDASMAVSTTTPAAGGHAVPEVISRDIDQKILEMSGLQQYVKNVTVGTPDYKELVDVRGTTGGWVGETDARAETGTSTLEQVAPTFGMVYAYPKATEESIQDMFFDVDSWIVNSSAEEMAKLQGDAIVLGDGSNKPTGFLNGTPTADVDGVRTFGTLQYIPTGAAATLPPAFDPAGGVAEEAQGNFLIDLIHSLKRGYRGNARFAMNRLTLGELRKFRDADGHYIWQPGMQAGAPSMLMGYEVVEDEGMPGIAADAFPIAFGDWNAAYTFCNRVGTSITVDDNITQPGYVKFYVRRRVGGILRNDDALKLVKIAAS